MNSSMGGNFGQASSLRGDKIPKGYRTGQLQQFTPEQMQLFQQLFSHVSPESSLSQLAGGDEETFNRIEGPAMRQFSQLQGNIASRFSAGGGGQGAFSGRKSSGFQNALGGASSDFALQLQSQRQALQRQALMDLMGISGQLLGQRPTERFLTPKEPSFLDKWLGLAGRTMGVAAQGAGSLGGGF